MPPLRAVVCVLLALTTSLPLVADAQVTATPVVVGLNLPIAFVQDPADARVQYVVEQGGRIRVVREGILLATPFIDLSGAVRSGGEQGLLGLAFPPDPASPRFFVNFTNPSGDTVVARFRRSTGDRLVADAASRLDLQWSTGERVIRQPFANHNGGNLVFGPDGCLYIGLGDGGSFGDPGNRAQDGSSLLGKMLRIDINVPDDDQKGFKVPQDNPFLNGVPVAARPETWAFGLRNPWRYSFDDPTRGGTGALVVGDVGQGSFEEVDYEPRGRGGRNYGWRVREGAHAYIASAPAYQPLTDPIFDYGHDAGVSIIGGFVYRGSGLGATYVGRYFYADLVGRVWSAGLSVDGSSGEARVSDTLEHTSELGGISALGSITSFGVDADGELYIVTLSGGRVLKLGSADSDGDGLPDAWEANFGLDPHSAAGINGADGDPDGDGRTNLGEYRAGTHPMGRFRIPIRGGRKTGTAAALTNPADVAANVLLRYAMTGGGVTSMYVRLPAGGKQTIALVETSASGAVVSVLVSVESQVEVLISQFVQTTQFSVDSPRPPA
jgi:glucose/arabinose dehydrogenase